MELYYIHYKTYHRIEPYVFKVCLVLPQTVSLFILILAIYSSFKNHQNMLFVLAGSQLVNSCFLINSGLNLTFYDILVNARSKPISITFGGYSYAISEFELENLIIFRVSYVFAFVSALLSILHSLNCMIVGKNNNKLQHNASL